MKKIFGFFKTVFAIARAFSGAIIAGLVVGVVLIALYYFASTQPPAATVPVVSPTRTISTPTLVSTKTPTPTTEPLYEVKKNFEYDPKDYGSYDVSWSFTKDPAGKSWNDLARDFYSVRDACNPGNYEISQSFLWAAEYEGDSHKPLTPACVSALQNASGKTDLKLPDQSLGSGRVIVCKEGTVCKVLTPDQVYAVNQDSSLSDIVVSDPNGTLFDVESTWTRVEPNYQKYPGFGNLKFTYPTTVIVPNSGIIPQMGIANFGGDKFCYQPAGYIGDEGGVSVPGGAPKCVFAKDLKEGTEISSFGDLDNYGWSAAWTWTPSIEDGIMTIKISEVDAVRISLRDLPTDLGAKTIDYNLGKPENYGPWIDGEVVTVNKLYYSYKKVTSSDTSWIGWWRILEGTEIIRDGKKVLLTGITVDYPCGTTSCMGQPDMGMVGHVLKAKVYKDGSLDWFTDTYLGLLN